MTDSAEPLHERDPNRLAFEVLVHDAHRPLLSYAHALLAGAGRSGDHAGAEDLVQDALTIAYENLHRYDPGKGHDFASWVRGIMRKRFLKGARSRECALDEQALEAIELAQRTWQQPAGPDAGRIDVMEAIHACMATLSSRVRCVMEQVYFKGEALSAVAEALPISIAALKKRLQRGRELLALCLRRRGVAMLNESWTAVQELED